MSIDIRKINPPYNYAQIAEILHETYFKEYVNAGALLWNEKYAKFYFEAIIPKESSRDFIFGAYDGKKIVGTIFGHRDVVMFENRLTLEMVNLGLTAVDPNYRRRGIAKKLVSRVIEHAKEKNLDFIMAFPEKGRYGDNLLKQFDFKNYGKTKHFIKLMEDRGLQVLREYLHYNVVIVKIASIFSHIPDKEDPEGMIRYANIKEIDEVREILNSYASRVPLVSLYSHEGYEESNINFAKMNDYFGDPWGFHWLVLEQNGEIVATISYRIEVVAFEPDPGQYVSGPVALLTSLGFHEKMDMEEKLQFMCAILRKIRKEYPEIYVAQITSPQHEMKVFNKLKFNDDQSTYLLYMKPLTEKGEELNKYKKYQEYFLQYYR